MCSVLGPELTSERMVSSRYTATVFISSLLQCTGVNVPSPVVSQ